MINDFYDRKELKFRLANADAHRLGLREGEELIWEDAGRGRGPRLFASGRRLEFALLPVDVHVPSELPTYLAGYRPFSFRADDFSPVVMVTKDEDYHRDFALANAFRRVNVKASPQGAIPEIDHASSVTKYKTVDRLLGSFVPQVTEDNETNPNYRVRQVAARHIGNKLALDREIDVLGSTGLLGSSSNWAAGNVETLGATTYWDTGSASDPLGDLTDRIIASAQPVTKIVLPQDVALKGLLPHASVRDQMRQYLGDGPATGLIQRVTEMGGRGGLGVPTVDFAIPGYPPFSIVASKVLNETTGALDFILDNTVLLLTAPEGVPLDGETEATSWTFRVRGNQGVGYETREFRIEGRGQKGGTMVVAYMSDVAQMTGNNCGGAIFIVLNPA